MQALDITFLATVILISIHLISVKSQYEYEDGK
jgi:hypothetical protein